MIVTVITMYRNDGEMFTQVVEGTLTEAQRREWRDAHDCDLPEDEDNDDGDYDDINNLFFREVPVLPNTGTYDLRNVDGDGEPAEAIEAFGRTPYKTVDAG